MATAERTGGNGWAWTIATLIVLLVVGFARGAYLSDTPDGKRRAAQRTAIEQCRAAQSDELQELSMRRAMRAACDRMEADYQRDWGRAP